MIKLKTSFIFCLLLSNFYTYSADDSKDADDLIFRIECREYICGRGDDQEIIRVYNEVLGVELLSGLNLDPKEKISKIFYIIEKYHPNLTYRNLVFSFTENWQLIYSDIWYHINNLLLRLNISNYGKYHHNIYNYVNLVYEHISLNRLDNYTVLDKFNYIKSQITQAIESNNIDKLKEILDLSKVKKIYNRIDLRFFFTRKQMFDILYKLLQSPNYDQKIYTRFLMVVSKRFNLCDLVDINDNNLLFHALDKRDLELAKVLVRLNPNLLKNNYHERSQDAFHTFAALVKIFTGNKS